MAAAVIALVLLVAVGTLLTRTAVGTGEGIVVERGEAPASSPAEEATPPSSGDGEDTPPSVVVHVDGAVVLPGVYVVEGPCPRINDVVALAGGLTPEANTAAVNLAAVVTDGAKVHIPAVGEEEAPAAPEPSSAAGGSSDVAGANGTGASSGGRVNLNTASAEELKTLPGVGDATATAIVEDRERNGPFGSPEDLMRVSGIGQKKFQKLQDMVCV